MPGQVPKFLGGGISYLKFQWEQMRLRGGGWISLKDGVFSLPPFQCMILKKGRDFLKKDCIVVVVSCGVYRTPFFET